MSMTKAELIEALRVSKEAFEAQAEELHAATAELQGANDALADNEQLLAMVEEAQGALTAEIAKLQADIKGHEADLAAAKAQPKPVEEALSQVGVLTSETGVCVIGGAKAIDQGWIHPHAARTGIYGVDVRGPKAKWLAERNAPYGIVELSDGTYRVEARTQQQTEQLHDAILRWIETDDEIRGKTTVERSPLAASAVKAKDAARANGIGAVAGPQLIGFNATSARVAAAYAGGKVTKIVITPT